MVQDQKSEECATSSKENETPVDVDKEIKENLGAGKKHLLCSDYPEAVACFQEACTLLSNKYGQMAQECSDAYYYYGVSLLELARLENGVLGNALKGVPEEDEESDKDEEQFEKPDLPEGEREKLREDVEAAMATEDEDTQEEDEGEEGDKKDKETAEKDKEPEKTDDKPEQSKELEEKGEEKKDPEKEVKPEPSEPSSSKPEQVKESAEDAEEDPDDISNMQLAWEMIELAKVLYKKREKSKANNLSIAQCHLKLGELGLEVENYAQAIGDFLECLVLQKEFLPETDRKLAETYYNLGLAYSFEKRYDNALEHYQNALTTLEARVDLLEEMIANQEGQEDKESKTMAECREVGEIKELIPDINSKIEDVLLVKKQNPDKLEGSPFRQSAGETVTGFGEPSTSQEKTCSTIPVRKVTPVSTAGKDSTSDISHLVRRKRPTPDDDGSAPEAEGDSKKAKQESNGDSKKAHDSSNGSAAKNGDSELKNGSNGQSTSEKTESPQEDPATALKKKMAATEDVPVAMES